MNIGKRFQLFRRRSRLTQKEAAKLVGVKSYQMANYESNRSEPSLKVLIGMAKAYHVSTDQLLGLTKKPLYEPDEDLINEQEAERAELEKTLRKFLKRFGTSDKE